MSNIESFDVIFFTCTSRFLRLNIVGSVHDIPFFLEQEKVAARNISIRAL